MLTFKQYISEEKITKSDLNKLEDYLDKLFNQAGLDIQWTKHFLDRVNDPRNKTQITIDELKEMYEAEYKKHAQRIRNNKEKFEAILKDEGSEINIPFVLVWNERKGKRGQYEIVAKSIMRKKGFKAREKFYKVNTDK